MTRGLFYRVWAPLSLVKDHVNAAAQKADMQLK